jgi:hypothetical protein
VDDNQRDNIADAWRMAMELFQHGGTVISAVSKSLFLYRLLSSIEGSWVAPALLIIWGVKTMPMFNSEKRRIWFNGN